MGAQWNVWYNDGLARASFTGWSPQGPVHTHLLASEAEEVGKGKSARELVVRIPCPRDVFANACGHARVHVYGCVSERMTKAFSPLLGLHFLKRRCTRVRARVCHSDVCKKGRGRCTPWRDGEG